MNDDNISDKINIIFELNGINRLNFQAKKNEKINNVILRYCNSVGVDYRDNFYYHNSKAINLNKTIEENDIENNSLIVVINAKDCCF